MSNILNYIKPQSNGKAFKEREKGKSKEREYD